MLVRLVRSNLRSTIGFFGRRDLARSTSEGSPRDTSGPLVRPPIVYACSLLSGLALHWARPVGLLPPHIGTPSGALLAFGAIALFALSVREFRRFETPVPSPRPTCTVVKTGPYRLSRNPIYVAFTLLQLGLAVWVNTLWLVATLLPTLILISKGVIDREEKYLSAKFGAEYLDYKASVRRWL